MKGSRDDRRARKTEDLLLDALVSLVVEKEYRSITVREVLDRANVGRTTFYAHFTDKDDLLVRAVQRMQEMLEDRLARQGAPEKEEDRLVAFGLPAFEHLFANRPVYRALNSSQARGIVRDYIPVMIANLMKDKSHRKPGRAKKGEVDIPRDLLVRFVVSAFTTVVSWWLDSPDPIPPKEADKIFRALVLSGLAVGENK